jgi:hypothetical protein
MMGEKTKYLIIILTAILLSTAASYITTTLTMQNIKNELEQQINQQQPGQNTTKTKINFNIKEINFDIDMTFNIVSTEPNLSVDNLTIVYQYTCRNDTTITENIDYGSYTPVWGANSIIDAGGVPIVSFRIPDYIIYASSSTKRNALGFLVWDVSPQVEVLEIYGYAESIA